MSDIVVFPELQEALSAFPSGSETRELSVPVQRSIGVMLAGGVVTQIIRSLLKRGSLGRRLHAKGTALPAGLLSVFWWVHLIYFLVVAFLSLVMLGWDPDGNRIAVPIAFGVGIATTLVVKWAASPRSGPAARVPAIEFLGDGLLSLSALLLTSVIWQPMYGWFIESRVAIEPGLWQWIGRGVVFLCIIILFFVFYLPARILFLIEDAHRPRTWAQIGLVLAPLTWQVFTH